MKVKSVMNAKLSGEDVKIVATVGEYVWLISDAWSIEISEILPNYIGTMKSLKENIERVWSELEEFKVELDAQREAEAHHIETLRVAA